MDLNSLEVIRIQSKKILSLTEKGKTSFKFNEEKMLDLENYVLKVIDSNYPSKIIKPHSRYRHFEYPECNKLIAIDEFLKGCTKRERILRKTELIILSVLLDAGAGTDWKYNDKDLSYSIGRSEGLALASLQMYFDGCFTNNEGIVDAASLMELNPEVIKNGFQISVDNNLKGFDGRFNVLKRIGKVLLERNVMRGRLGSLFNEIKFEDEVQIDRIFTILVHFLNDVFENRPIFNNKNLGDCWKYSQFSFQEESENYVPFHKLTQWLTYSLMEVFTSEGLKVNGIELLTPLPEYRNGGLLIDSGVLELIDSTFNQKSFLPSDDLIIEWRALTICLIDRLFDNIRKKNIFSNFSLPMLLEGGTWSAGRKIASEKRSDGSPPLNIISDGTVF